jgi:hypothetical protein
MSKQLSRVLIPIASLAASAALAQSPPPPAPAPAPAPAPEPAATGTTVAPLTVKRPPTPKTIHGQVRSFVHTYAATPNPEIDQIGRWREPVCVKVFGLPLADQAAAIKSHIEAMAVKLRLHAPRAGCRPNVEIFFTDTPQEDMDVVAKRRWDLLGYYHRSKIKKIKTVTHSIQAWYVTATRSDGGNNAALVAALDPSGPPSIPLQLEGEAVDDPDSMLPGGCVSRFTACLISVFKNVLIVADSKALDGAQLRPLADDMLMLALSQPQSLDGCNAFPSVIDRFAKAPCLGREPPDGLTPADTAYLAALYSADLGGHKNIEQADIGRRMAKILASKATTDAAAGEGAPGSPADAKGR